VVLWWKELIQNMMFLSDKIELNSLSSMSETRTVTDDDLLDG